MWQILAFISAIFSASAAVFEKKALFKMNPVPFSLVLSVVTFILALPFFAVVNFDQINNSALLVLYLKSVLGAAAFLLVMYGLKNNDLSNSLPLLAFTPAVVAVLGFFFLQEKLSWKDIGGMILLLFGTYLLQLDKNGSWLSPFYFVRQNKAQWFILGAIALFSITSILDKTLLKGYKLQPEAFLPIQQLFFSINFFVIFLFQTNQRIDFKQQVKSAWLPLLGVAVFAIIYRYTHILAVKSGMVALVLSIKRTSVFFATVFGGSYFKEKNIPQRSFAVFLMVAGAIIVILAA